MANKVIYNTLIDTCHMTGLEGATENASTEKVSTGGWNTQVRKT